MASKMQVNFRLEKEILERIDAHAARVNAAQPGLQISRTDALRVLLVDA